MKFKKSKDSSNESRDDEAKSPSSSSSHKKHNKKPTYSRFTQQELPACKPILTPGLVILSFTIVGLVFIPIGFTALVASGTVVEIVDVYDKACVPGDYKNKELDYIQNAATNKTCTRTLTVQKLMKGPVYVYYQLDGFYQNHRRYVKSRSDEQLKSKKYESVNKECKPEQYANDKPIVPCGLVAWSLFNDTYKLKVSSKVLEINKKNIAWESDKEHKFGSDVYPQNFQNGSLIGGGKLDASKPLSEQEDLMVWMRTAALPSFRKLYGRIEQDLQANEVIDVEIQNNYNSYNYGGKKALVLSTTSWLGGKNKFLGVAYIVIGALCWALAIIFVLIYVLKPRPLGDPSYLSWNKDPAGLKS